MMNTNRTISIRKTSGHILSFIIGFLMIQPVSGRVFLNFPFTFLTSENPIEQLIFDEVREAVLDEIRGQIDEYTGFPQALSEHYGNTTSLTSHLTLPLGGAPLARKGTIAIGLGFGAGITKVAEIKAAVDNEMISNAIPEVFPTLGIGINIGLALSADWDIRVSLFPLSDLELPSIVSTDQFNVRFRNTLLRVATSYRLFGSDKPFYGSLSLGGYFAYSSGSIAINFSAIDPMTIELEGNEITFAIARTQSNSKWKYYSGGLELRANYNFLIFLPYIGLGLGIESGRFESNLDIAALLDGVYSVNSGGIMRNLQILEEPGNIVISDSARSANFPSRLILGFEFNFYRMAITTEIQYFINKKIYGVSVGADLLL